MRIRNYTVSLFVLLFVACKQQFGVPKEDMLDIINQFEAVCESNPEWKLESDDGKLTVYCSVDTPIEGYASNTLVIYHDGNQSLVIPEEQWRHKYHLSKGEYCPLFSDLHYKLFTIENKLSPETPVYVIVTSEVLDDEYKNEDVSIDGMWSFAHAYTIRNGELQQEKIFMNETGMSYMTDRDTTFFLDWVHDVESVWPATYNKKDRILSFALISPRDYMFTTSFTNEEWKYDDKLGFRKAFEETDISYDSKTDDYSEIAAMTELLPRHKVRIAYDSMGNYQYAAWPKKSSWKSKPSIVLNKGEWIDPDYYLFKSQDGYEYRVYMDLDTKNVGFSIKSVEVWKQGKQVYHESIYE